ncbi:MAG: potassium-transporting ATPase subunit C [Thermoplasmata archaeon]
MKILKNIRGSIILVFTMVVLVSILYPYVTVTITQFMYPNNSNVPVIYHNGTAIASPYMAENFTEPWFFHPRPSLSDYSELSDNGSGQYGPLSSNLYNFTSMMVSIYYSNLTKYIKNNTINIPLNVSLNAVSYSSSNEDPGISLLAALIQIPRVSYYSKIPQNILLDMVQNNTVYPQYGIFGIAYINIVPLNIDIYYKTQM